ncbi:MAG: single-stranded DNA-binding protein [Ruminococcaceae bacterium]|jgi:single-strand DNA-binding protein|nr:single-stranded DNA-binding protein [Oscillospiraceae bacterium]
MLNKAILMGRLTAEPELRQTQSNIPVTTFRLAVDRSYARQGEQKQTDFINIVCWRQTAEFVSKWFHKGQLVAVSGRIQTRDWQDQQGNRRTTTEVVADEVFFAESKRDSQSQSQYNGGQYGGSQYNNRNSGSQAAPSSLPFDFNTGVDEFQELSDDDGELPF